jgi:glycosyltransferase involved in cell wall biosynthesis
MRVEAAPEPRLGDSLPTLGPTYRIAFIGGRGVAGRYSGIETFYEEVGSRLAERGHKITAYCRPHFTPKCESYRGIHVRHLPAPRSKHFETLIHSFIASLDAMRRRFDIVHIHAIGSSVFSLLPRLGGCRTVVTVHGLDWQRPKWKGMARTCLRGAEWASVRLPTRTTAVSQSVAEYLEREYGAVVDAIPNGVNHRARIAPRRLASLGLRADRYILFVGRLSEEKGCEQLLNAFRTAAPSGYQLAFAGGATYASAYEQRLHAYAGDDIRFLGWVDQEALAELYSNCALFVLPSSMEGLSVALLEAMSYAAPVLVSDIAENVEVTGDCGAAFEMGNLEDLTRRLSTLLADASSLRAMGERGRQRVRTHFTWDATVRHFERVYQAAVEGDR